ncbi:NAD-dependent epimerase/dehydratase family protein [Agromyces aerolatus]|uniref:NAD-dependent epimerase/dehydratase family protein n=1 Tax=Agromyces sp. LY-1074 TaxID=3074080 RepID=UPI0028665B43|nr:MULTISPECIES: NAD-dependent epimerase/dehydratase family protein [unclassified Agromyces]MDR5698650.1 NAD-dependent epimerase/dehydratase family protein [Agromyces sp. LY-1074]MDR5704944.1 NAD-dependent epimerase/dehydratase family protein [Agromyces sp. LY-1358]
MELLILGGTAWLGRALAADAVRRGHRVICLARGEAGDVADGAELVVADRSRADAYDAVAGRHWDAVVDVTRHPGFARRAAAALAGRAAHWTFVSSGNVYARHDEPGADESAELLPPLDADESTPETYGEAKSAIEHAYREALDGRLLIVRPGLIGGPGDASGRSGYYVARAARDDEPMLVPAIADAAAQLIDVRDLVTWMLDSIEHGLSGAFDAVGVRSTVGAYVAASRAVGGHRGESVEAPGAWLAEQGVAEWSGPESLPLWIADPAWAAFQDRSNAAAVRAGLRLRPLEETLADLLEWERVEGLTRDRGAGLTASRERELVASFLARTDLLDRATPRR